MQTVYNIANNTSPIRYRSFTSDLYQAAEHVVPEVLVSKVVQRMMAGENSGWIDLALIHTLSIPFIGGLGAFFVYNHPGMSASYFQQTKAGAAGIPAVLLAQYALEVFQGKGLLHGGFNLKRFLSTAVSKVITRPLVSTASGFLDATGTLNKEYTKLQERFDRQAELSIFSGTRGSKATPGPVKKVEPLQDSY